MAEEWPRRSYLALGALNGAVPSARLHARQVVWEWGLDVVRESLELVVSELVTNAVKATRAIESVLPVRLWLLADQARVLVLVSDSNPQPPRRMDVGFEAEGGRGLVLVEACSEQWNWYAHRELGGKVIWALIIAPVQPPPPSAPLDDSGPPDADGWFGRTVPRRP